MTDLSPRSEGQHLAELATDRAERFDPGFSVRASSFIVAYLRTYGPASGEDVTDAAKAAGIAPGEDRAFGSIYASLARRGLIVAAGVTNRRKGHGSLGARVWRAA